jgi:BirA family biotin operon repressor/biotin-[acetyl-CoA-carboxylase] ligase
MRIHLSHVDSTNTLAKYLLRDHPSVLVTADYQTAGRGRNGKTWEGASGENIYLTYGYRHIDANTSQVGISGTHVRDMALAALCVIQVLRGLDNAHLYRIKYPNDVQVLDGEAWKKLSGVLVEHEFLGAVCTSSVVGIGINVRQLVFPETITQPCTSLLLLGVDVSVEALREKLIAALHETQNLSTSQVRAEWFRELDLIDRTVQVVGEDGFWKVTDIDDSGRIRVQHNDLKTNRYIDDGDSLRYND